MCTCESQQRKSNVKKNKETEYAERINAFANIWNDWELQW